MTSLQDTDLKTQMFLLGTSGDLYQEAVDNGRLTEDLNMKVGYSDIFISPWCCDSSHEDRYEKLIGKRTRNIERSGLGQSSGGSYSLSPKVLKNPDSFHGLTGARPYCEKILAST